MDPGLYRLSMASRIRRQFGMQQSTEPRDSPCATIEAIQPLPWTSRNGPVASMAIISWGACAPVSGHGQLPGRSFLIPICAETWAPTVESGQRSQLPCWDVAGRSASTTCSTAMSRYEFMDLSLGKTQKNQMGWTHIIRGIPEDPRLARKRVHLSSAAH
ncbi:hypothetical protein ACRALDRAFT_211551 [Sodiomyces alcalophilus JCM 7366]|uniref:uncharacterized protein n=1 Tax=Sodiomyces alcalophilus JCM 7366 TaxID=591952 RepID=UPI0039B5BB52